MPITNNNYNRIIIMSSSGLGDAIFITPALRTIRENFPESLITLLYSGRGGQIFKKNSIIDDIIRGFPQDDWNKYKEMLIKKKYDLGIILDWNPIYRHLAFCAGIKNLWSITKVNDLPMPEDFSSFYNSQGNNYIFVEKDRVSSHLGLASLDLLRKASLTIKNEKIELTINDNNDNFSAIVFKEYRLKPSDKVAIIHPGTAITNTGITKRFIRKVKLILRGKTLSQFDPRCWSIAKYAQLVDRIVGEFKAKVIITGGLCEAGLGHAIVKKAHSQVINLAGKTNVEQLISLMKSADLLVSGDTGPLHLAMALKVPVAGIYGPTILGRTGPWGDDNLIKVVKSDLNCSPCVETKNKRACKIAKCMENISVEEVFSAVASQLSKIKEGHLSYQNIITEQNS